MNPKHTLKEYADALTRARLLTASTLTPAAEGTVIDCLSYDTRSLHGTSLFLCKGAHFKAEYLSAAIAQGAAAYVAEKPYPVDAPQLLVSDIRYAMVVLGQLFYDHVTDKLTSVGITGTKGKSTTAYYVRSILNDWLTSEGKPPCAILSSIDNYDGVITEESHITTPEVLELYQHFQNAYDSGISHLVMEVSSQAYKVDRVYGLTFDVAAFLNISPDHISPIEHPTFEDYLYCKRQIIVNAKSLVLGADSLHADLLREDAEAAGIGVTTFALHDADNAGTSADVVAWPADPAHASFHIADGDQALGDYHLSIDGDFNYLNAAAAIAIAHAVGVSLDDADALHAIESVRIAGRMEQFRDPQSNTLAIVDYAHNYASVTALLDFVYERWGEENPRITLVTGSAGNKAYDRRKEIVEAAENRIANFIFTAEDTDTEPFIDICMEMQGYITNKDVASTVISDRPTAITNAIYDARAHADRFNILLIIGKGNERWIKDHHKHVPFDGDDHVVERMFGL